MERDKFMRYFVYVAISAAILFAFWNRLPDSVRGTEKRPAVDLDQMMQDSIKKNHEAMCRSLPGGCPP